MNITTMQKILPIQTGNIGGDAIQTVNGRKVHAALAVRKDYSDWVKVQIQRARLSENKDFVTIPQEGVGGKFSTIDYHFTIEASKHIAMICGTDKGFEVRDYFIACEKQLLAPKTVELSRLDILQMAVDSEQGRLQAVNQVFALETTVARQTIKVEAFDRIATTVKGSLCIRDASKSLQITEKNFKQFLFGNHWVYNRTGAVGNKEPLAYSDKLSAGLLEHKIYTTANCLATQVRVTSKGIAKIAEILSKAV